MQDTPLPSRPVHPCPSSGMGELGSFHVGNLTRLPEVYAELGGNLQRLLKQCGLDPHVFCAQVDDGPYNGLPFSAAVRLLSQAAQEVRCPHFGLLLGQRLESSVLGPVGFLMQHSPTVSVALQHLGRFLHLRAEGIDVSVTTPHAGVARFAFQIQIPQGPGSDQIQDMAMASFVTFMRLACGKSWQPSSVSLSHHAPDNDAPYHELFGQFVRFNQAECAMRFPAHWLQHPVGGANPSIEQALQGYMVQVEARHKGDIVAQVRRVLPTLLPTGKCTIERVADLFSMHRRTLHRHLALQGVTFEHLLDHARQEIAEQALRHSNIALGQLASTLGYRDVSAFSRAFRRWSGMAPSDWRHRQDVFSK